MNKSIILLAHHCAANTKHLFLVPSPAFAPLKRLTKTHHMHVIVQKSRTQEA